MRIGLSKRVIAAFLAVSAIPAIADSRFTLQRIALNGVPPGLGVCEIRLQVDDTVEVTVDADQVYMRTLSGRDGRDDGSGCNIPLPRRELTGFNFEVKERRGDIQLVQGPTRENGGRVVVRIHDGSGGFGRYIFRLSWRLDLGGPPPPIDRRGDGDVGGRDGDVRGRDGDRRDGDAGRDLRIVSASWGARDRSRDVTRILNDRIRGGRLHIQASNEEMGFDPAQGVVKALSVVYESRGRRQEVRIPEGGFLDLP
jgi:hypothetical protein